MRKRCVVCEVPLPETVRESTRRCRPCDRELSAGRRRWMLSLVRPPECGSNRPSLRELADPEGWARHLEGLAARAAAGLDLFPEGRRP